MQTRPWSGVGKPYWAMFPYPEGVIAAEDYEERSAIMEFHGGMCRGLAEQAAYSFVFADKPELMPAFLDPEEDKRQLMRAGIIQRNFEFGRRICETEESQE